MKERKRERERERESGLGRKVRGPSPVHSSRTIAVEEGCLGQLSSLGQGVVGCRPRRIDLRRGDSRRVTLAK